MSNDSLLLRVVLSGRMERGQCRAAREETKIVLVDCPKSARILCLFLFFVLLYNTFIVVFGAPWSNTNEKFSSPTGKVLFYIVRKKLQFFDFKFIF